MAGKHKGRRDDYKKRKKLQPKVFNQLYADWQDRQVHCLKLLIEVAPIFNRDIATLRADAARDLRQKAIYVVKKYAKFGLRPYAIPLIAHFIEHDEVNAFHMLPAVIAVSTKENIAGPAVAYNDGVQLKAKLDKEFEQRPDERVYLVIHPDARKEDLLEWVNSYYDLYLEERLENLDPTRPKRTKTPNPEILKRDMALYEHIIANGQPAKDVADEYGLNEVEANKYAKAIQNKIVEPEK